LVRVYCQIKYGQILYWDNKRYDLEDGKTQQRKRRSDGKTTRTICSSAYIGCVRQ